MKKYTVSKKTLKQAPFLVVPEHIGKLISQEGIFYKLFNYIQIVKPVEGEIGFYNGSRIIINFKG